MIEPKRPLSLKVYSAAIRLAGPAVHLLLARRSARGKEDPARIRERFGETALHRPAGPLTWVHAASVGETTTMLPLVHRLIARGHAVLLTTVTVTSAKLAAERLPAGALHQFLPVDMPEPVERFLDHWSPDLAIFAEQEIWPNLLEATAARAIPLCLANARMSPKSFSNWKKLPAAARRLLSRFSLVLAQSEADGDRIAALGAPRVVGVGNLKFDAPAPQADAAELARWQRALAGRPCFAAASTHVGEDEIVFDAHARIAANRPDLLTLIAPRHPERGDAVEALARARGLGVSRRSRGEMPGPGTAVFLIDTIGELGLVYRSAPIAFMGKSLAGEGGQNPIEAARLGAIVLHGPKVHNFTDVYRALDAAGAAIAVDDAAAIAATVEQLLADPAARATRAAAARTGVESFAGVLDRVMLALEPFLLDIDLKRRGVS